MRILFKLLIVDDETIEREGMTEFIPWEKYDIKIVGGAWNGLEGYEMIKKYLPDIVLTDIKMPVLDGLELIRKVKKDYPDIFFIVLSGYGEFEFTSQAMELGVKYYILKPCDEDNIVRIMEKVKTEIAEKRQHSKYETVQYKKEIEKLLPHAKEQFFRDALLKEIIPQKDYLLYKNACIKQDEAVRLLVFRAKEGMDFTGKFVVINIMEELLEHETILLSTYLENDVIALITDMDLKRLKISIQKLKIEFLKFDKMQLSIAVSDTGSFFDIKKMYEQADKLFYLGKLEGYKELMTSEMGDGKETYDYFMDYEKLKSIHNYPALLLELKVMFIKFSLHRYSIQEVIQICSKTLNLLFNLDEKQIYKELGQNKNRNRIFEYMADTISENKKLVLENRKDWNRFKQILLAVYENIDQRNLNLQWLAKCILFMNEEYLGRLFTKYMNQKFSSYLSDTRIEIAKRLLRHDTKLLISELAEQAGYTADAQYFCKVFKSKVNMTPSEYKEYIRTEKKRKTN